MRRQAGFTLMEVMVVVALVAGAASTIVGFVETLRRDDRAAARYVREISEFRAAVRSLERDLRAGARAAWRLEGDRLVRDGRLMAKNVTRFELARKGRLTTVELRLGRRSLTLKVRRRR